MVMPYLHLQVQARDRVLVGRLKHQEESHQHMDFVSCITTYVLQAAMMSVWLAATLMRA